jgi:hypothetical protein
LLLFVTQPEQVLSVCVGPDARAWGTFCFQNFVVHAM